MESRRRATVVRRLEETRTRRGTLAGALLALAVPVLPQSRLEVRATKRKKKCKCPRIPEIPEPPCQEACPGNCFGCVSRKEASLLYTGGFASGLTPCSSDGDCLGTGSPYCLTKFEERATGDVTNLTFDGQGRCGSAPACDA